MILRAPKAVAFDERAVDLVRARRERHADEHAAELVVDQHRAVAAPPVERDQPVLADVLRGAERRQVLVHAEAERARLLVVGRRHAVVDVPGEDVADAALAGLVAPLARHDPAVDDAAHPGHLGELLAEHHVAGRGAHDRDHPAGLGHAGGRRGDVRVDVADGDGDALGQPGPGGRLRGQRPGARAQLRDRRAELVGREAGELRVQRRRGSLRRGSGRPGRSPCSRRCTRFASRRRRAARRSSRPPRRSGPSPRTTAGILLEQLQGLGELPLRGDPPAVAAEPRLAARRGEVGDAVGLRLRGVVAPQLDPRVRVSAPGVEPAQRRAVGEHRQHRAGGEVGADPDHRRGVDPGGGDCRRNGAAQHLEVVVRILERPVGGSGAPPSASSSLITPCGYGHSASPSSSPSSARTTSGPPDNVPKSTPTTCCAGSGISTRQTSARGSPTAWP